MPKPPSDRTLEEAAEHRACGLTWPAVAEKIGWSVHTIKHWPRYFADRWAAAYSRAERRLLADASAHSIVVLRNMLQSASEKNRREAARILLHYRISIDKLLLRAGPPTVVISQIEADLQAARSLLQDLTDEQQEAYLEAIRPQSLQLPGAEGSGVDRASAD